MKNKKKIFEKILLCILTFLLICYTSVSVLSITFLNVSKNYINKNNIANVVNNIDISSMIKEVSGSQIEQIEFIRIELKDLGLSEEAFNAFINSDAVREFSEEIIINVLERVLNDQNIDYKIDENRVRELLEKVIPELKVNGDLIVDAEQKLNEMIDAKVPILVEKINNLIDSYVEKLENSDTFIKYKNYFNKSLNIFDVIYSKYVYIILTTLIVSYIVLMMYIRKSVYKSLKWISISFLIPSSILYLISLLKNNFIIFTESGIIGSVIGLIINDFNIYAIIYFILAISLILINIIAFIIKRYKNREVDGVINEQ